MQLPQGITYGKLYQLGIEAKQTLQSLTFHDMCHWGDAREFLKEYSLRIDGCQAKIHKLNEQYAEFEGEGAQRRPKTQPQLVRGHEDLYPVMLAGKNIEDFVDACDKILNEQVNPVTTVAGKNGTAMSVEKK